MAADVRLKLGVSTVAVTMAGAPVPVTIGGNQGPRGEPGGNILSIGLFTDAAALTVPVGTNMVQTSGYSAQGLGAGLYVNDSLADAALAAAHPGAVLIDATGRRFRLVATGGEVTPEQFGCPRYAEGTNQQPSMRAAMDYAQAIKCAWRCEQNTYESWPPLRVPDPAGSATDPVPRGEPGNLTGLHFVITRKLEMRAAPGGTTINRRMWNGGDPAVMADIQTTADNYGYGKWRGGLFAIIPQAVEPADPDELAEPVLIGDWTFNGGLSKSATPGIYTVGGKYRLRADGSAWDIYDKCFWYFSASGSDYVGHLLRSRGTIRVTGFNGETFFGNIKHKGLRCKGSIEVSDSDCGHFDFGLDDSPDAVIDVDTLHTHDNYLGMERCGGWNVRIGHLISEDNDQAGGCFAGDYTESDGGTKPNFIIERLTVSRCGTAGGFGSGFVLGKWVKVGEAVVTDAGISIGTSEQTFTCHDVSVDRIRAIADSRNNDVALSFNGPASPTTYTTSNCNVGEVWCERTAVAIANSRMIARPVYWSAHPFGSGNFVGGVYGETTFGPECSGTPAGTNVGIGEQAFKFSNSAGAWNVETTPALGKGYSLYQVTTTSTTGNFTLTLPAANTYPRGSYLTLTGRQPTGVVITVATTNSSMGKRAILLSTQNLRFKQVNDWWVLDTPRNLLIANVVANLQKAAAAIPANDVSDETAFTVNGAVAGMHVKAVCNAVISADALLVARVTAANTVGIRMKNLNAGATLAPGSQTYRLELEYLN